MFHFHASVSLSYPRAVPCLVCAVSSDRDTVGVYRAAPGERDTVGSQCPVCARGAIAGDCLFGGVADGRSFAMERDAVDGASQPPTDCVEDNLGPAHAGATLQLTSTHNPTQILETNTHVQCVCLTIPTV